MKFNEFIKEIENKKQETIISLMEKHIKTKYIRYEEKVILCQSIINGSFYKEIDGKKVFLKNTPIEYMLFITNLYINYTDFSFEDMPKLDLLNYSEEYGLTEILVNLIGKDVKSLQAMLDMMKDDKFENERNIVSFLDTKLEAINMVSSSVLSLLEEMEKTNGKKSNEIISEEDS